MGDCSASGIVQSRVKIPEKRTGADGGYMGLGVDRELLEVLEVNNYRTICASKPCTRGQAE